MELQQKRQGAWRWAVAAALTTTALWSGMASRTAQAEAPQARAGSPAPNRCFAEYTGDNTTDVSSADSSAVQMAVLSASVGSTIKLAGVCVGVSHYLGGNNLAAILSPVHIVGGYTMTNWAAPVSGARTVLDADRAGRVFYATAAVTLENLVIRNGLVDADTGGGAYLLDAAFISNTQFVSNTVTGTAAPSVDGHDGGGAYVAGELTMVNSAFISNTAANIGGGLEAMVTATLTNTSFYSNTAAAFGGGRVKMAGTVVGGEAISNTATATTMYAMGGGFGIIGRAHVEGAYYARNVARGGTGGGLWTQGDAEVMNSVFENNWSNQGGGGFMAGGDVVASGLTFRRNTAGLATSEGGGGLYANFVAHVSDSLFENNVAYEGAGAELYGDGERIWVTNTQFLSNTAIGGGWGGAVNVQYGVEEPGSVSFHNVTMTNNSAVQGGGLYVQEGWTRVTGGLFARNAATETEGGGLFVSCFAEVSGTTFLSNTAAEHGGGIAQQRESNEDPVFIEGVTFRGNQAGDGAALWMNGVSWITGSTFLSNAATGDGGAVYYAPILQSYYPAAVTATVTGSWFQGNTAATGGAFYLRNKGDVSLTNNVFAGNAASGAGEEAYAQMTAMLSMQHNTFVAATAGAGDALVNDGTTGSVILTNSLFAGYATGVSVISAAGSTELNGVLWDNVTTPTSGTATVNHDVTGSAGFVDAAAGNYLAIGAAKDAGVDSGVATDIRGAARPQGAGYDLGAYEAGDATLINLAIVPGALAPAFVSSTTSYTTAVPAGTTSAAVTATTSDVSATVAYSSSAGSCTAGARLASPTAPGDASVAPTTNCVIAAPKTWITVTVTAADGATKQEYYIEIMVVDANASTDATLGDLTIAPGTLAPAFVSTTKNYAAGVPNGTTQVAVTATPSDAGATVVYSSSAGLCAAGARLASPAPTANCAVAGPKTWITATVTAGDGKTIERYYIEVTVAAPLTTIDRVWPGTGLPEGGMPVQIFGSGFTAALTVTVDGVAVPFTVTNDGQIEFVMPPGVAGQSVDVTVAAADGAVTAVDAFTYVQPDVIEFDGETGGVFTTTDGVVVTVPPQGVSGNFVITMTPLPPEPGVPGNILMHSFRLDALLNWVPLASLTNPVTIRLPIDENIFAIADGERPWLYRWTGAAGRTTDDGRRTTAGAERAADCDERTVVCRPSSVVGSWTLVRGQQYDPGTRIMTVGLKPMGLYALSTAYLRGYYFPVVPLLK